MKYISKVIEEFENVPYKGCVQKRLKNEPADSYFYLAIHIANCMVISNDLNQHFDPVRIENTVTRQIKISQVYDPEKSEPKEILANKNTLQVCSTDKRKLERIIVDENSTEESESESVHKSINTNKEEDAIDETYHEEPLVTDNPVINKPIYFNLFKCGKHIFNRLDAMYK